MNIVSSFCNGDATTDKSKGRSDAEHRFDTVEINGFTETSITNSRSDANHPAIRVSIFVKKLNATAHQQLPMKYTQKAGKPTI